MKIFFRICLLSILFIANETVSQTITWSKQLTDNRKAPYLAILGANEDDDFFIIRSNISLDNDLEHSGFRNRLYILQCFSSEFAVKWEKELKTSYEEGKITDVRMINEKVIVTSYLVDKKTKTYSFYSQYLDKDGNWIGQPILLDSFSANTFDDEHKPGLISSRDQLFIAFSYRMLTKENTSHSYRIIVMDTSLSLKYKKQIDVPISSDQFIPLDFMLTNQGSFFILGIHYATEKKVKEPGQSYYELFGYNLPLDRFTNTSIKSENKFLTDVAMSPDNVNHSVVVAGFYSDKTTYSVAGVFYYALSEDSLKEKNTVNTPFSDAYLQKFLGERKENRELVNYSIDRLIVRKDGGVALAAESIYETNRSYYDYFMQTYVSHVYYHYGNIMLLSVNPDGKILWNNVIPKDQNSVDDEGYYSSYFSAITAKGLVAIYNRYIEDDSSILITYVAPGGVQKTESLFSQNEKTTIIPRSSRQIDEETILMPAYKNNKFFLIKVSF